ncbi:MAG TPA: stage IV sporulation protein A [Bacilli bacterium]|jgi:stage IV sporulation protein A|nr:stage IV sporulation protein A [Acholeplasmataceae bacterium]OQB62871.1 MAG: Stage IV sporulation protein A [Tenericutes bacterium ADurb.Bin140]HOE77978.1 stage IV sporulation protein A [Bacilli bacterium]HON63845.1 stage IV sporulation protein A [Bacilli bacterium]HOR95855.1 stage IV sporulation protein A [Bacilli bacterium]
MSDKIMRAVATRTSGEVYIGVVGAVRSGKSTFIRHFMEKKVLPYIRDDKLAEKVRDELPQSAEGKTIMTVEPKFVPSTNIKITVGDDTAFSVRLVDCVGYVIPSANGYLNQDGSARLVKTPWYGDDIPFEEAATLGTQKVIESHSHIGVVITSDGSFGDFSRSEYEKVEEQIVNELKELGKPFVIILNTVNPNNTVTRDLAKELAEKYGVSVIPLNLLNVTEAEIDELLKEALNEFDISELNLQIPDWVKSLKDNVSYKQAFATEIRSASSKYRKMKDVFTMMDELKASELFERVEVTNIDPGTGVVDVSLDCSEEMYQRSIEEIIGRRIENKGELIGLLQEYADTRQIQSQIGPALQMVNQCGYGLAVPSVDDMVLAEPEIIKQSGRYGIKLKATAPALQITKVDVDSSFEPIIGPLEQAEALLEHMVKDYQTSPSKLWNSEIFGRKLCDVIGDGIKAKIHSVPDHVQYKFKEALGKVINHGKGLIITIII